MVPPVAMANDRWPVMPMRSGCRSAKYTDIASAVDPLQVSAAGVMTMAPRSADRLATYPDRITPLAPIGSEMKLCDAPTGARARSLSDCANPPPAQVLAYVASAERIADSEAIAALSL